jgi:hypothetical protein
MRTTTHTKVVALCCLALGLFALIAGSVYSAAVETPTGKRIPGQILEEGKDDVKIGTDLPGGGRIIFNVDREKVDPHGTVPGKGRIEDMKGKVEIKKAGMTRFATARKNMAVNPGDEIRTEAGSEAVVTLETTAVSGIGENTEFKLDSFEVNPDTKAAQVKVNLPKGKLWSEVGRLKTKDSNYNIETPTAVTGVRGTVFLVEVEKATADTSVSVISGQVAVGSKEVAGPETIIGKREALVVKRGQAPSKYSPSELLRLIARVIEEWTAKSEYFKTVTALAGIGQVEEIEIEPGLPEAERQKIFDAIQAGWEKASEDFFQIDKALKLFYLDFGRFPTMQEGGLNVLIHSNKTPQWNGPYTEDKHLNDHYGAPYGYAVKRDMYGEVFAEITTFGYDGEPNTQDDRSRIFTESDARRWEDDKNYR